MCGIVGIVSPNTPFLLHELGLLCDGISHRGPDDEGYTIKDIESGQLKSFIGASSPNRLNAIDIRNAGKVLSTAGIGHRRFAIIDTSESGHQPFQSSSGDLTVSFNGEIYNFLEIRSELIGLGRGPFITNTDTEVLVKAYETWGTKCFEKFNGFWALAILDGKKLILSRDRVGKKPLYYSDDSGAIIFASEITPILDYRRRHGLPITVNEEAVFDYLRLDRRNAKHDSLYTEIKQVKPSTFIEVSLSNIKSRVSKKFWSLSSVTRDENFNLRRGVQKFNEVLTNSIALRLRADVPVEANLSGGLDSAAIVALASKLLGPRGEQLTAHNISYTGDKTLDESTPAALIANHCGADFRQIVMDKADAFDDIDSLIMAAEEPVHSMAALVQNKAWQHIADEGFKVILHGSANDEIMLGYDYLKKIELLNRVASGQYKSLIRDIIGEPVLFLKLIKWLTGSQYVNPDANSEYFSHDFLESNKTRHFDYLSKIEHVNKKTGDRMMADLKSLRIPYWCSLMDKNMMNVPVEVRMPFLDHKFLEFIFSVPEKFLLRNGYTKYLLRESLKDSLPQSIVWNRTKVGFSVPKESWLQANSDVFSEDFDYPGLNKFFNVNLVKSKFRTMDVNLAWRFLNFAKWYRLNKL